MRVPIEELVLGFVREALVAESDAEGDVLLHGLVANALIGLHFIGGYDVTASLQQVAGDGEANARAAAAFAMGQMRDAKFQAALEALSKDESPLVRSSARTDPDESRTAADGCGRAARARRREACRPDERTGGSQFCSMSRPQ